MGIDVIFGILTAIIGFFLIKFWSLVDEIRKDIKALSTSSAVRDEKIKNTLDDVEDLKIDVREIKIDLSEIKKDIIILKENI
jgi:hypothetical protein